MWLLVRSPYIYCKVRNMSVHLAQLGTSTVEVFTRSKVVSNITKPQKE